MEAAPDAAELELCPWDQRRTSNELYVKMAIVHFTVIGAYAHLIHLRREPRDLASYVLMAASPISGAALVGMPVLVLLIQTVVCKGNPRLLAQSVGMLIGRVTDEEPNTRTDQTPIMEWPPKLSSKMARRVAVQLALLTQCTTSIWLFTRRVRHGSDALYDHRIFQLSILGMCVSVMSLIHEVFKPRLYYRRKYPDQVSWLAVWRPITRMLDPETTVYDSAEAEYDALSEVPLLLTDVIYSAISLAIAAGSGLRFESLFTYSDLRTATREGSLVLLTNAQYVFLIMALVGLCFRRYTIANLRAAAKFLAGMVGVFLFLLAALAVAVPCMLVVSNIFTGPFLNAAQLWTLFSKEKDYQWYDCTERGIFEQYSLGHPVVTPDWDQIATFGLAPTNCLCPVAWKDDVADYVWWLA